MGLKLQVPREPKKNELPASVVDWMVRPDPVPVYVIVPVDPLPSRSRVDALAPDVNALSEAARAKATTLLERTIPYLPNFQLLRVNSP